MDRFIMFIPGKKNFGHPKLGMFGKIAAKPQGRALNDGKKTSFRATGINIYLNFSLLAFPQKLNILIFATLPVKPGQDPA